MIDGLEEGLYKINDDFYFKMDSTNFILAKKTIVKKSKKNKGTINYPSVAFYPPSQKGIEMLYEKYLSLNLLDAEDDVSCLKDLVEELKYYHADFINFLSQLNMDVSISDLEKIVPPKKEIESKPIKKKRKMLRRRK